MKWNIKNVSLTLVSLLALMPAVSASIVSAESGPTTANSTASSTSSSASTAMSETAITAQYTYNGNTIQLNPDGQTFQIAKNSKFDPTNITLTNGGVVKISGNNSSKVIVESNPVDTSKAGSFYKVKLSVNGSTISYNVLVKPEGPYRINKIYRGELYSLDNDSKLYESFGYYQGDKSYIGNNLVYFDGKFYTAISLGTEYFKGKYYNGISSNSDPNPDNGNLWIDTDALLNPSLKLVKKTVMHRSLARSYVGGGSKYRHYKDFSKIYVVANPRYLDRDPSNKLYYQVFEKKGDKIQYTSDWLRVSDIDGTKRTLTKNAYVYATSNRRASNEVLKKGTKITTYGASYKFKNGKKYYRIEGASKNNKRYVKVANFK